MKTANDFFNKYGGYTREEMLETAIEFAKLHVKLALEASNNLIEATSDWDMGDEILNAYSLTNIK